MDSYIPTCESCDKSLFPLKRTSNSEYSYGRCSKCDEHYKIYNHKEFSDFVRQFSIAVLTGILSGGSYLYYNLYGLNETGVVSTIIVVLRLFSFVSMYFFYKSFDLLYGVNPNREKCTKMEYKMASDDIRKYLYPALVGGAFYIFLKFYVI